MRPEQAFGKVLRELRVEKGLSQEKLALEANLDRTFISLLERGLRQPSFITILEISKILEVSAAHLVELTETEIKKEC
ncbi:helix-turn-helix domain-containing protein [Geomonas nitrogeniifigens]|uniref:helix-turn-helix domain-containing protein n=1 Tax=Geomonas diazotrophica TaxID=2843197 RepID=UPI001C2BF7CA|nr:helix-turn-helix transcriptional regulator [Geomonas nitrogeniifigens]QXE86451.1 helix-turn-helix domain-containing protein [Geomonas nitrogeniifigens]